MSRSVRMKKLIGRLVFTRRAAVYVSCGVVMIRQ